MSSFSTGISNASAAVGAAKATISAAFSAARRNSRRRGVLLFEKLRIMAPPWERIGDRSTANMAADSSEARAKGPPLQRGAARMRVKDDRCPWIRGALVAPSVPLGPFVPAIAESPPLALTQG